MSSPKEKYKSLVDGLYKATRNKEILWEMESFSGNIFTNLGRYSLYLDSGEDADGAPMELIVIKNEIGEQVECFSDNDLTEFQTPFTEHSNYWRLMQALRSLAQRSAMGADDALDEVLNALRSRSS